MQMQMNFYSDNELSIRTDYSGKYPFPKNEKNELLLFTCFTLRQFQNLGQHLVAKTLAGVLISDDLVNSIFKNDFELPSCHNLLSRLKNHIVFNIGRKYKEPMNSTELFHGIASVHEELNYRVFLMEAVDTEILRKVPDLVEHRGKGGKNYIVNIPPFRMKMNGFGFLGRKTNHHSFHSVIGLIRYLGQDHFDDDFIKHLSQAAILCGSAYSTKNIPIDVVKTANKILTQI